MSSCEDSLVSIIIPVYNCEKYIEKCLESVKNQTYSNIEVIIVNDGSIDNTLNICNKFTKEDKRFKVVNQENHGVSYSRNVGIKKAKGKYIQFTDADDWLDKNMIKEMVFKIEKEASDIVICEYYNFYQSNNKTNHIKFNDYHNLTFKDLISDESTLYGGFPWNKLFKKEIITTLYDEDIHYYENLLFFLENAKNINKYSTIHKPLYTYNINENSAVHSSKYNPKKISILYALLKIVNIVDEKHSDLYKYYFISRFHENYIKCKTNNLDLSVFDNLKKYEVKFYNELKINNKLSFKKKIKLFIIKKMPHIYKILKK